MSLDSGRVVGGAKLDQKKKKKEKRERENEKQIQVAAQTVSK